MKRFWKIFGFTTLGILAILYLAFLFILPSAIDLNQYKADVQKLAKEQANLDINFENVKIITTPLLGAGIKADNISIKLPDGSLLFSADNLKTRISLPSIFVLTVKVSCLEINNPFINLEIENNKNFKIIKLIEDILNEQKEQRLEEGKQTVTAEAEGLKFNPEWIRIKVPCVKINNYKLLVNDLKSKHYLDLHGEQLKLGYFNGKTAKIKTYAELYSDEAKNISANIDINTFLPAPKPKLDSEDDPAERIEIPFINPVTMYRNYDLKADLDTKLRIRNHKNDITSFGHFNLEGITLKVSNLQLPVSYLRAKTFSHRVFLDTNIYAAPGQNIQLLGKLNYGKRPKMDMNIKTGNIKFNDMLILAKAFLDSLHIYNELAQVTAEGTINADCYIRTNFKKLKSSGSVIVKNGGITVKRIGKVISRANINLILDNNILDIKNSSLFVNASPINIDGRIDEKSVADISIRANSIPLPVLFNAFAPRKLRNAYNFRTGNATIDLGIKGKLKNAIAFAKINLNNFNFADKANSFNIKNNNLNINFTANSKNISGSIDNKDLSFLLPKTNSSIIIPKFALNLANNNIQIEENTIEFNNASKLKYSGEIIDYNKLESVKFLTEGNINTEDLIKLIGKEYKPYIHYQGTIPTKISIEGNKKKQTIFAQSLCNKTNYITPIDFTNTKDIDTSLQAVVDLKPGRIKIKKTGLYKRTVTLDEKGNEVVTLNEVFGIDGTIAGDNINLLKITIPETLYGKIFVFPKSEFKMEGRAFVFGSTSTPRLRGGFEISDLSIPELFLSLKSALLRFQGNQAAYNVRDLALNESDIHVNGTISLLPSALVTIPNLDITSKSFNLDKVMKVADAAMKYVPKSSSSTSSQTSHTTASADIPVVIRNGSINFNHIITGNINVNNTRGRISLADNVFLLRNLKTDIFKGNVDGTISVNLISTLLNINLNGKNIDVEKALLDAAGMKGMLSGKADFTTDISLQGSSYEEQMKSLVGNVTFLVKDGQFGPFGKLENLILAENIRESQFFQSTIGNVLNSLLTIDTTHFSELIGTLSFEEGICHINPITSLGNILSLHVAGDFDLLKNYTDMKVRARMASLVSNLLGPIGAINPANILNSAASLNVVTAKAFSLFCEMVPEEEINALPSFSNSYIDNAATKFQIVVRGDVAKPLSLVKSFKWLASQKDYDAAMDFVASLPEPEEGSTATNIEEAIQEAKAKEAEKKTLKYKIKHIFKED